MSTNTPKRPDETDKNAMTPPMRSSEQQHQQPASGQKLGASGTSGQQSTGGMPPTQGTGSTPQSHTARPSSAETSAHHGTTGSPSQAAAMDRAAEVSTGTFGGTQDHGTVKTPQGENVSTQGQGPTTPTHPKTDDARNQAQDKAAAATDAVQKASDLKEQAQTKMADVKGQAQGKLDAVTSQAQDTLESVRASLQTKTDALKGTVTGKTDQLVGTVGEKGDQAKQAANEKSTQAGEKLAGLAGSLRDKSQTFEPDHPVANAATKAAGALEQTGAYLQQSTPDDWVGDLKQLISHKPIESVLVAASLGYMAARAFRK